LDLARSRLSGKTSKKVIAINAPEEKAKKYCKTLLNLTATRPPIIVEAKVTSAIK
jgi:hypothetical protein